jgi:hypothetical protein
LELTIQLRVQFVEHTTPRGAPSRYRHRSPRCQSGQALDTLTLPPPCADRQFCMPDRSQRARVYEIVLGEGDARTCSYIDGVLLIDLWDELLLPRDIRAA